MRSSACDWPIRRGSRTVPPSMSGTPQRRQNTPNTASRAATRRSHQTASSRPPGDRVALDRGEHRLGEQHAARAHRAVAVVGDPVDPVGAERLQVGAGAERPARAGEHRDREVVVGVEGAERVGERGGGRAVDRVARLGPVDRDDRAPVRRSSVVTAHGAGSRVAYRWRGLVQRRERARRRRATRARG